MLGPKESYAKRNQSVSWIIGMIIVHVENIFRYTGSNEIYYQNQLPMFWLLLLKCYF